MRLRVIGRLLQIQRVLVRHGLDEIILATHLFRPDAFTPVVREVIAGCPEAVRDYRAGKGEALNYLVGQVMKRTRGRADPKELTRVLTEELARGGS